MKLRTGVFSVFRCLFSHVLDVSTMLVSGENSYRLDWTMANDIRQEPKPTSYLN